MNLKEKVKNLPLTPGVYLMEDARGNIIYIGKAKNLKNRVRSYFQNSKTPSQKLKKLKANIADFTYILLDTEFEAFMLECKLIREKKPIFNRMMKNPQTYSYIRIQTDGNSPRFEMADRIEENSSLYFGPFTSKHRVEKAVEGIKEFFQISCSNPTSKNTPCLNYSLGLCIGICFRESAKVQYKMILNKIIDLLNGTDVSLLKEIKQRMTEASLKFDFETAAKYRDNLNAIHSLIYKEAVIEFTEANKNIAIIESLDDHIYKLFLIKGNKILFSEKYNTEKLNMEQIVNAAKTNLSIYFTADPVTPIEVSRDDIDEAQIIYSYLKSNNCHYLIIPDHWIGTNHITKMDNFLANTFRMTRTMQDTSVKKPSVQ
ncbi:GIY-YIG nuclease family protein [Neobacillus sp. 19]|uniref:GIY-YIG nuclease family protein n=1 Tax=Neobacillus sp. 19 TaxID=3394458 RepID=UPI003BF6D6AC